MSKSQANSWIALALLLLVIGVGLAVHLSLPQDNAEGSDIYYPYVEGKNILAGQNPYLRILTGDMQHNQKYATYFPMMYLLSALTQRLGLRTYGAWLGVWRAIILAFSVATGGLIYYMLWRKKGIVAGVFGALFWFLGRWSLHSTTLATYDAIPIFFLLLSLWLLPRRQATALLLFGVSLAFKHIAIWLVPLYLIWVWQTTATHRVRALLSAGVLIAVIPALISIPFLVWPGQSVFVNTKAFLYTLAFQLTRDPNSHFLVSALSLDEYLGLTGVASRLPMFAMFGLVYALFWRRTIGWFAGSLMIMATFVDLNPVLFFQYLTWLTPFVPLVLLEVEGRPRDVVYS
jgi:hypothetical protein